jgi:hypothetical protein
MQLQTDYSRGSDAMLARAARREAEAKARAEFVASRKAKRAASGKASVEVEVSLPVAITTAPIAGEVQTVHLSAEEFAAWSCRSHGGGWWW